MDTAGKGFCICRHQFSCITALSVLLLLQAAACSVRQAGANMELGLVPVMILGLYVCVALKQRFLVPIKLACGFRRRMPQPSPVAHRSQLLMGYHPFWMRLALETVVGKTLCPEHLATQGVLRKSKLGKNVERFSARMAEPADSWPGTLPAFIKVRIPAAVLEVIRGFGGSSLILFSCFSRHRSYPSYLLASEHWPPPVPLPRQ